MPTVTIQANKSAYLPYEYPNTNDHKGAKIKPDDYHRDRFLIGFAQAPESVKFKKIDKCTLYLRGLGGDIGYYTNGHARAFKAQTISADFDAETVTYNNAPARAGYSSQSWHPRFLYNGRDAGSDTDEWHSADNSTTADKRLWYKNGLDISAIEEINTAYSNYKPYMVISYQDDEVTADPDQLSPASGYVPKAKDTVFSWALKESGQCLEEVKATATTFRWRAGSSGTVNTISCGTAQKVTVPAGTFTTAEIQWSVAVTLNTGKTVTSDWITLSTVEETPTAKTISPAGIVVDATVVSRFSWQHIISTGTPQTKADLQWSADGETWNTLATVTGEDQFYDVPANTFTSGTKYWRVRTYNTDGTASEWSEKAEFIAINAPAVPSIVIQSTGARPRITWQTTEQEAYQLTLSNGYASGTVYGTNKTWRSPLYLADGNYTVRVRVQNKYGMWSEWGAAALPVSHTEGEAITIGVSANHEAALAWQTAGSYDFYIVERDGIAIARTTEKAYVDHTSIGDVSYRVRGCYADSDSYGLSNAAAVTILPGTAMVCDLDSGAWLRLPLSETMLRTSRVSRTATIQTVHLSGLDYPVAERTEFRDLSLEISCAFLRKDRASVLALEAMLGRLVCAKTKHGDMSVGYITSLEKNADEIMARYSFEVTNIYRREEISLDP